MIWTVLGVTVVSAACATVCLWARAAFYPHHLALAGVGFDKPAADGYPERFFLCTWSFGQGVGLSVGRDGDNWHPVARMAGLRARAWTGTVAPFGRVDKPPASSALNRAGFDWTCSGVAMSRVRRGKNVSAVFMPHWFPVVLLGLIGDWCLRQGGYYRKSYRNSIGLCPRCGYDLRGNPAAGRCPECGTPAPVPATPPVASDG
jgi:hypothetical protein